MTSKPRIGSLMVFASLPVASFLGGCIPTESDAETTHLAISSTNGLAAINGLSSTNGLAAINGLNISNGLAAINGLSSTTGLMTTSTGRTVVEYLVRCALPSGTSIVKKDQYGASYTFLGSLGLGPGWQNGACDTNCQEMVSACMMAHINTAGVHIPLWLVAANSTVGWALDPAYPNQEGSFFGNIFVTGAHGIDPTKIAPFYCDGNAYDHNVVPGRIGSAQTGAPYLNPYFSGGLYAATGLTGPGTDSGFCMDYCTPSDYPYTTSGYKACSGWNNVLTTYRQAASGGAISTATTAVTATITKYLDNGSLYCANVNVKNKTTAPVSSWTVVYDTGTASQTAGWFSIDTVAGSQHSAAGKGPAASIPPGGTANIGYCAAYKAGTTPPSPLLKSVSTL